MLEIFLKDYIPFIVQIFEVLGALVIIIGSVKVGVVALLDFINKRESQIRIALSQTLALGLQVIMIGEVLKTVTTHEMTEIYILAGIVLIRAALAVLIHWEMSQTNKH
jgi:uncharacterized membrane protein